VLSYPFYSSQLENKVRKKGDIPSKPPTPRSRRPNTCRTLRLPGTNDLGSTSLASPSSAFSPFPVLLILFNESSESESF
jgi:hypothetical protein